MKITQIVLAFRHAGMKFFLPAIILSGFIFIDCEKSKSPKESAEDLLIQGMLYSANGTPNVDLTDLNKAEILFTKAIEVNPNFAEAYFRRGLVQSDLSNQREAISDFQKAIQFCSAALQKNPGDEHAYFVRGMARECYGERFGAISDYNHATNLPHDNLELDLIQKCKSGCEQDIESEQQAGSLSDYDQGYIYGQKLGDSSGESDVRAGRSHINYWTNNLRELEEKLASGLAENESSKVSDETLKGAVDGFLLGYQEHQ